MQSGYATRGGYTLMRTPSPRLLARRRRAMVVCAMVALAIVAGLIGSLTGPGEARAPVAAEFSPFPAQ